jgi:glycosyltransferase involved in cell wall biosynthesis
VRVLGLSMDASIDFRANPGGKNAGLLAALDRRFGVVGTVWPELGRVGRAVHQLAAIHPDRDLWRRRYNLSPRLFDARSARAEALIKRAPPHDLIVQVHTLCGPGRDPGSRRFVLHTDCTYALTERHHPEGAPLRGRDRARFVAQETAVYRAAEWLFPRSEWLRRSFIDDYGCDPARVVRVGGGVNLGVPTLDGKRWDQRTAVFVGYEFERKGGPELLAAFAIARRRVPSARLIIVGPTGPAAPGVTWVGRADRAGVARAYAGASVFVMPSRFEPWGHVFLEAMASGLACVGVRACAMPEIVTHGETGLLAAPGDVAELAEHLVALLGDPDRAEQMGRAAWSATRVGHTWDDVAATMAAAAGWSA